jgi:hypothetical protein
MRTQSLVLISLLAAQPVLAAQKKKIRLSDTLAARAERLDVKKGTQWAGHIAQWRFGDYGVVASKGGWTTTQTDAWFFELESASAEKFSFVLTNGAADSARVNAARHVTVQSLRSLPLGNGWWIGQDELVQESDNLVALIAVTRDTSDTWQLFMGVTHGGAEGLYDAFLTNGARKIVLAAASSNKDVYDIRGWPALGYEFVENGQSVGAVQFFSGSAAAPSVVWLQKSLDAETKLVLAAAMTAILQVKSL